MGTRKFAAHEIGRAQIAVVGLHIRQQNRLPAGRGRSHNSFTESERKITHHLFAMPHRIANAQVFPLVIEQQYGEKIVRNDAAHDLRDVGEQLIQFEGLRRQRRDLEQKIEQIAAFAEPYGRLYARRGHVRLHPGRVSSLSFPHDAHARACPHPRGARRHHRLEIRQRSDAARSLDAHRRSHGPPHQRNVGHRGPGFAESCRRFHEIRARILRQTARQDLLRIIQKSTFR